MNETLCWVDVPSCCVQSITSTPRAIDIQFARLGPGAKIFDGSANMLQSEVVA